jgi:hypothetical protein
MFSNRQSEPPKISTVEPTNAMAADHPIYRYTAFPNLCVAATATPNPDWPAENSVELRVPCCLSVELVILSWAQLLRGYVATDNVVFRVEEESVNINVLDGSVEYLLEGSVQTTEEGGAGQRCSGIYFRAVGASLSIQISASMSTD